MEDQTLASQQPYLIRALYEWICDNQLTPYLAVDAEHPGVQAPQGYIQDGAIILNVAPSAVQHLHMGNDAITFNARFGGVVHVIEVPVLAVKAIYANENSQGMMFPDMPLTEFDSEHDISSDTIKEVDELSVVDTSADTPTTDVASISKKPTLKIIK